MTTTRMCLQVSRPAQEQKQSLLGSPETAGHKRQQTGPGQVGNAPGTITHYTEHVRSSTASAHMAAASSPTATASSPMAAASAPIAAAALSPSSSSSSTSVGVPAANSVSLAAATDDVAPQVQAVEGVHDALRQQEAVAAGDDTSDAHATAAVGSQRKDSADESVVKKAGVGQGQSPRLLASPHSSQGVVSSGALPSKRKMVAESDASIGKKMSGAPESEAEVGGNGNGLTTSLLARPTEANAKVSLASLHALKFCRCLKNKRKDKKRLLHLSASI